MSKGLNMFFRLFLSYLAVATIVAAAPNAIGADSHDGTWILNVEKSNYSSHPPPKSETVTITTDATSHHVDFVINMVDGATLNGGISFPSNGGPLEIRGFPPDPEVDHAKVKIVNKDKFIFSFDTDNKLASTRVIQYDGNVSEAKFYVNHKLVDSDGVGKQ